MDTFTISLVILAIAVIWMLFAARRDYISLKQGNHTDMKSVIVSIGILGTFIGIALGLWNFDTTDITKSVPELLEGLKLAFATSIAGMLISISLSTIQRGKTDAGNDDLTLLNGISEKLTGLTNLEKINDQLNGWRVEFRDEMNKSRSVTEEMIGKLSSELATTNDTIKIFPTADIINNFRNEIHEEQIKMRDFLQEQFISTNNSLKQAIDVLSKGATEEIIKALETVISDFNKNLTEQFGENFKELNSAVINLIKWQEQHKEIIEKDGTLLKEIRISLATSSDTIEEIAKRNDEVRKIYEQLKNIIETYDTQVSSINEQLEKYKQIGDEAKKSFEALSDGFEKVQIGIGTQSETISILTKEISEKLPVSLGQLENTLVGLTTEFGKDYKAFLDRYKSLVEI